MSTNVRRLIIFEGNEGTGKSTHIKLLSEYLIHKNVGHYITREPGGSDYGEAIRDIVLDKNSELDALSDAFLLYSSRFYNFNKIILEKINNGDFVITDRFHYSTLVYQGYAQNCNEVIKLHEIVNSYFEKYIAKVFLFKSSLSTSSKRVNKRKHSDKFESKGETFLEKINESYELAFKGDNSVVEVSTDSDVSDAQNIIRKHVDNLVNE